MATIASTRTTTCAAICQEKIRSANGRGRVVLAFGMQRGIARQERGIDGAFAEDGAEIVGKQKCERGRRPTSRRCPGFGHRDVAHETGDAGEKRETADREQPPEHLAFWPSATSFFT